MSDSSPAVSGYAAALAELKQQVRGARFAAQRRVNMELVRLHWRIGSTILQRQGDEGWGSNIIGRLATDLRAEFSEMNGFSPRNVAYMRAFAAAWPEKQILQQAVAQLPWGHITVLLDRFDEQELRDWYASQAYAHGWSRNVLEHQICSGAHTRLHAAPTNFAEVDEAPAHGCPHRATDIRLCIGERLPGERGRGRGTKSLESCDCALVGSGYWTPVIA